MWPLVHFFPGARWLDCVGPHLTTSSYWTHGFRLRILMTRSLTVRYKATFFLAYKPRLYHVQVYHCCLPVSIVDHTMCTQIRKKHDIDVSIGGGMNVTVWEESNNKASVCRQLPKSISCKRCSKFFPERIPGVKQVKSRIA